MPILLALTLGAALAADGFQEPADPPGFLLCERYRYPHLTIAPRVFADMVAIPASMPRWSGEDWAVFGAVGATTIALMLPTEPSPDARIDQWAIAELDPWLPDIWGVTMQAWLWSGMTVGGLGTWGIALLTEHDQLAESMSLSLEALSVAELYHLSFKLVIGREGPRDGDGLGLILGPTESVRLFPAGTPSGHFATFYSILAVQLSYWDAPWPVGVAGHVVVGGLAAMHVFNHRHFASDIVWGGGMGYATGLWVVRHRSTRYRYNSETPVRIAVQPWRDPGSEATGLVVSGRF